MTNELKMNFREYYDQELEEKAKTRFKLLAGRTAIAKYKRDNKLNGRSKLDNNLNLLFKKITGKKSPEKGELWNVIFDYCQGEEKIFNRLREDLLAKKERKHLKRRLKKVKRVNPSINIDNFQFDVNNFYSKEKADQFYKSSEWRKLRVHIIEEQKGKCQMCGRSTKHHDIVIHVDHIIPLSIDWSKRLDKNNLQLLCEDCNLGKVNHYITDWRKNENYPVRYPIQ